MPNDIKLRGKVVKQSEDGLVSLDDIWAIAGRRKGKSPSAWRRDGPVRDLQIALYEKLYGATGKYQFSRVIRQDKVTRVLYAHPVLAVSYASFLSAKLAVEVKEVWLRYAQGDPTLADEILQRSSKDANEWAGVRALSRVTRKEYTETLCNHGVKGSGYGECTNEIYRKLFDNSAFQLKLKRKLSKNDNLRDTMELSELTYLMAAESLAKDRIADEDSRGNTECAVASGRSAYFIKRAINDDVADRRRSRLL